jgi:hypothetical protein
MTPADRKILAVYEITTTTRIVVAQCFPPQPPRILNNIFEKGHHPMAQRTGTVTLAGPVDPSVTSIPITITGSSVAGQNPITIDLFLTPTPTFQANDGDILMETGQQVNAAGSSAFSVPIEIVVALGTVVPGPPAPTVPVAPSIASNTFV